MRFHEVEPREARACPSERGARRFTPLRDLIKSVALQCTISNVLHGKSLAYTYRQKRFLRFWRSLRSLFTASRERRYLGFAENRGFVTSGGMTHNVGANTVRPHPRYAKINAPIRRNIRDL